MAENKAFAARFNQALDEMPVHLRPPLKGRGRQQFVARMFGVSQKGARKWLEGEALPRTNRIPAIARRCLVRGEWLLTGQGAMRLDGEAASIAVADRRGKYRAPSESRLEHLIGRLREAANDGMLTDSDLVEIEGVVLWLAGKRYKAK